MVDARRRVSVELNDGTEKYIFFSGPALIEAERLLGRKIMDMFATLDESSILRTFGFEEISILLYVGMKGAGGTLKRSAVEAKMHTLTDHLMRYLKSIYDAICYATRGKSLAELQELAEEGEEEEHEKDPSLSKE